MLGQLPAEQNALFYEFCIERHVPSSHLLRQIDTFLDLTQPAISRGMRKVMLNNVRQTRST